MYAEMLDGDGGRDGAIPRLAAAARPQPARPAAWTSGWRRLTTSDRARMHAHFEALDRRGRLMRFRASLGDAALGEYVRRLDFTRTILVGTSEPYAGKLVALAEVHLDAKGVAGEAEIAVTVLAPWRRQGIARRLCAGATALAFQAGAARAVFFLPPENIAMGRLVSGLGGRNAGGPERWLIDAFSTHPTFTTQPRSTHNVDQ